MATWRAARWLGVAGMSLALLGADAAAAKKVKHFAGYDSAFSWSRVGNEIRIDLKVTSKNPRCRDALRSAWAQLFLVPDEEYEHLLESTGLQTEYAESDPLDDFARVGRGHLRFAWPAGATFSSHSPRFEYTGTYTFERWFTDITELGGRPATIMVHSYTYGGRPMGNKFKLKWKRGGVKHVLKCDYEPPDAEDE